MLYIGPIDECCVDGVWDVGRGEDEDVWVGTEFVQLGQEGIDYLHRQRIVVRCDYRFRLVDPARLRLAM